MNQSPGPIVRKSEFPSSLIALDQPAAPASSAGSSAGDKGTPGPAGLTMGRQIASIERISGQTRA